MTPRHLQQRHATRYLGYHGSDTHAPFASYFEPEMASLAAHVIEALNAGPQAGPMLTVLEDAGSLLEAEWEPTETGYALLPDGSMRVAVHTPMPEVTPRMWDWWFSWHGDDTRKYKLWHPRAHVFAQWADADLHTGPRAYVGRTSYVDEYLGSRLIRAAINFLPPSALGMDETRLADPREQRRSALASGCRTTRSTWDTFCITSAAPATEQKCARAFGSAADTSHPAPGSGPGAPTALPRPTGRLHDSRGRHRPPDPLRPGDGPPRCSPSCSPPTVLLLISEVPAGGSQLQRLAWRPATVAAPR